MSRNVKHLSRSVKRSGADRYKYAHERLMRWREGAGSADRSTDISTNSFSSPAAIPQTNIDQNLFAGGEKLCR
jgi:hypothetical protein